MVKLMAPARSSVFADPGWEHGVPQDEKKKKVKCNYCGKVVSGGIYRLKQHLARVSGEVTYCDKAPEEVFLRMKGNLEGCRSNKKSRQSNTGGHVYFNFHSNVIEEEEERISYRSKGKLFMENRNPGLNLTPLRSLGYVDPGWEHGVPQDERKKKVKCNYCEKIVSGGINRFKQHLARIPGEVAPCKNAPEEVYLKIKENMKWHRTGKRHKQPYEKEIPTFDVGPNDEDEEQEEEDHILHQKSKEKLKIGDHGLGKDLRKTFRELSSSSCSEPLQKKSRLGSVFLKGVSETALSCKKVKEKIGFGKKSSQEVYSAICKFFYHAGVPLQAANSPYFHKMLELVGQYGHGLAGPSSQLISGYFLQEEIKTIKNYLVEYKASWAITGCSVMADSWVDTEGRTFVNFLASCPYGIYFVSSVDVTYILEDALNLFKLLDKVVEEVGEENVVQVITENTPTYKAAGKMLEEKRRNLFWTPCAIYCIDRMLEDFLKLKCVWECIEKGQKVTKFIYNNVWLLNLMKKEFTQEQELLMPSLTQFASSFATLQNLLDHRTNLKRMFQSNKWISCQFSKSDEGKEMEKIIVNVTFWKKVQYVCKSVNPVMQVLQKVYNDQGLSMPFVYNDMYRAKLAIKAFHDNDARKYGPFWSVIENHWSLLFHHPLHTAAYFLNPSCRYRPDFVTHAEMVRGLNESIARLEPDNARRISASMQISDFNSAKADFGTELAISTRTELDPAAWWQQHGISCLELQRIAVHILSQTCSSSGCEHKWSIYDQIHTLRYSRLAQKRLNDLTYVHYNLRLRENQLKKRSNNSVSLDNTLAEHLLQDWIAEAEKRSWQEDEEIRYGENGMAYEDDNENDRVDYEGGTQGARKGSMERLSLADVESQSLDIDPVTDDEDDGDLNYYNDDVSD
ncbi:uncharacterized protein LOC110421715 [Herrania umbratica]|uniref:Uncharacterized protein LOC110421715 n=1 Tax=Herrania umbratica TaxID=108875 RepID=A0A6J1AVY3_9ROSI|nr:uncharacterized protein LOC110421715 [Herrania umbratica]XP_021291047.1 uncharacterized protein LOC110421715 [Herrania umbratica]